MKKPCSNKNKGVWSKEEDQKLIKFIQTHGEGCWRSLPQAAGLLRSGKSCRLRWINYLRPDLKRGKFAEDEEDLIIKLHALLGNRKSEIPCFSRWSLIAGRLPGRTDNEVKSYWNSDHLRRKMIRMGIGPNNNYGLSRNIPSCPQNQWVLAGNTSSGSKNQTCQPCQPANSCAVNDLVSNAGSFVENNGTCILPDLNLDLIMAIPSESFTHIEEKQQHEESKLAMELNMEPCPTLLLFK